MTTEQMPMCSHCGTLLPTVVQAAEFRVINQTELAGMFAFALAHAGWRVLATFSEPAPRHVSHAGGVWGDIYVQEPRFIIGRGGRDELIEDLKASIKAEIEAKGKLQQEVFKSNQSEKAWHDRYQSEKDLAQKSLDRATALSGELEQLRANHEAQDAAHRRLEADFGKVRAAIGEIALKKILDGAK